MHSTLETLQQQIRYLNIFQDEILTTTWARLAPSVQIPIWERHGHAVLPKLKSLLERNASIDKIVEDISSPINLIESSYQRLKHELCEVSPEAIDAIFTKLVTADPMIYWEQQSKEFQTCLKEMLQKKSSVDEIFKELTQQWKTETDRVSTLAAAADVQDVQRFDTSIGHSQLNDESVLKLTNLIEGTSTIEMFSAVNQTEGLVQNGLKDAVQKLLRNERLQHIMFPVGPGHWYWVTISKTGQEIPYSIEVFDPFCHSDDSIYKFLDHVLPSFGIEKYTKSPFVNSGHIKPQQDAYSCGYYVAAYAHLKVKVLDPNARCNDSMIQALKEYGNQNNYLRDICLNVINPKECREPRAPQKTESGAKSQSFQLFSPKPSNSSNHWNLRGVQQAIYVTFIAEALALAIFFPITLGCPIASLLLLLMVYAVAAVYISNTIEPLTYTSRYFGENLK